MAQPSERLRRAVAAGDVLALFPIFKDWSTDELLALLKDAEKYCAESSDEIDTAWHDIAFRPAIFLGATDELFRDLAKLRDEEKMKITTMMSEVCSVAIFNLGERGVTVDGV